MLLRLSPIAAILLLGACAAAVPGYAPSSFNEKKHTKLVALQSGDVGQDGRYEMSQTEKSLDCKRMTGSMHITIARLKDAQARGEQSGLASSAHKNIAPLFGGSTAGADRQAELARERAKLEAYNRELAAKGCKTVDLEAEFARPLTGSKKY
jgi:hypothetical protein